MSSNITDIILELENFRQNTEDFLTHDIPMLNIKLSESNPDAIAFFLIQINKTNRTLGQVINAISSLIEFDSER